jgi:zinc/manganese transport system permease protein
MLPRFVIQLKGKNMDHQFLEIMLPPFLECLVLVGIHSYLGLHVIKRGVIFVDLALAQIAALGMTIAFIFHHQPDSNFAYWLSLGFTFVGATIFSLAHHKNSRIPQEAIIGVVYAIAAGIMILVIDKAPHGAEHIKDILTGSLLWVDMKTVGITAAIYLAIGIFHYIFRENFIAISENYELAEKSGLNIKFWDFLFYASFGIVITNSVRTAGVLLVFVFLIAPAILVTLLFESWRSKLIFGWIMGFLVTGSGLTGAYVWDLPTGPTIVTIYGIILALVAIFNSLFRGRKEG